MDEINQEQLLEDTDAELQGEVNAPEAEESNAPQGLTEQQIRQIMQEERAKIAEESAKAFRAMQSMTDKKARAVASDAQKQLEAMKSTGAQFTPEMERDFVNRTVNSYLQSISDEQPAPAPEKAQSGGLPKELFDAAGIRVSKIAKKFGVEEFTAEHNEQLNKLWANVKDLASYDDFLDKAEDVFKPKSGSKTPPQARIASLAGNGGTSAPTAEKYKSEMLAARGKPNEVRAIKEKYKKAGLDVDQIRFTQG